MIQALLTNLTTPLTAGVLALGILLAYAGWWAFRSHHGSFVKFIGCTASLLGILFVAASNLGSPYAINNSMLQLLPSTQYVGVWRMGFAALGDAPPLYYTSSNSACSLNSGNGDGGSQIKSADGKCWLGVFPASGADISYWGASCSASDNTSALNAAATWAASQPGARLTASGCKYTFLSAINVTLPVSPAVDFFLEGAADNGSVFYWPNGSGGFEIIGQNQGDTVHIHDISFTTGVTAGGTGLTIQQNNPEGVVYGSDIKNVTLRGDTPGSGYWTTAAQNFGWTQVRWSNVTVYGSGSGVSALGDGINISGLTSGAVRYAFSNLIDGNTSLYQLNHGIIYGPFVQGLVVANSGVFNGNIGIYSPSGNDATINGQASVLAGLWCEACQFGVYGSSVLLQSQIDQAFFENNVAYGNTNSVSIYNLQKTAGYFFTGNSIAAAGGATGVVGIELNNTASNNGGTISGNFFLSLATGVLHDSGSASSVIVGNTYTSTTTKIAGTQTSGGGHIIGGTTISFGSAAGSAATNATSYVGSGVNASEAAVTMPTPGNGIVRNCRVWLGVAAGGGLTDTITLMQGGGTTSMVMTALNTNTASDTTHEVNYTVGQNIDMRIVVPSGGAATQLQGTCQQDTNP